MDISLDFFSVASDHFTAPLNLSTYGLVLFHKSTFFVPFIGRNQRTHGLNTCGQCRRTHIHAFHLSQPPLLSVIEVSLPVLLIKSPQLTYSSSLRIILWLRRFDLSSPISCFNSLMILENPTSSPSSMSTDAIAFVKTAMNMLRNVKVVARM